MINIKALLRCDTRRAELMRFLENNVYVRKVQTLNDLNDVFCTMFNFYIEMEYPSERCYLAFKTGLQETFQVNRFVDLQVCDGDVQ